MGASGSWSRLNRASAARSGAEPAAEAFLAALRREPAYFAARRAVKQWVRERFGLGADATVEIREDASPLPGFPPRETVIEFRIEGERHHFKVFKPLVEVREEDLPPAWLRDALAVPPGDGCDCC